MEIPCLQRFNMKVLTTRIQLWICVVLLILLPQLSGQRSLPDWLMERMSTNLTERNFFLHRTLVGVSNGVQECQAQFHWERWNCNVPDKPISTLITLGEYFPRATRETAFLNAIVSSSITLSVADGCSLGGVDLCWRPGTSKGMTSFNGEQSEQYLEMLDIGKWISEYFTDYIETAWNKNPTRLLLNKHNNHVGRKVVRNLLKTKCACRGTSGSCTKKMCIKILPHLKEVGSALREMYTISKQVSIDTNSSEISLQKEEPKDLIPFSLVYAHDSPNYCHRNLTLGSKGTLGRICKRSRGHNARRSSPDHCYHLCTSCGYKVKQKRKGKRRNCACKFFWCCHVKCKECRRKVKLKYCG